MKRIAFAIMAILIAAMPLSAQNYRNSRYYNPRTGHLGTTGKSVWIS